ncbi:MAG: cytosine permease, partial [Flavobacteriales bacterium]
DYFISKTYKEDTQKFNWSGIFSWICGVVLMLSMTSQIKNILGIVIAAAVYYILQKIKK